MCIRDRNIQEFIAAAKMVREKALSRSQLTEALDAKTAGGRDPSPPTRKMLDLQRNAQETIREAKQKASPMLGSPSAAWRQDKLTLLYNTLAQESGQDPVSAQTLMRLNRKTSEPGLMRAFAKFEADPSSTVSLSDFVRHLDIMLPGDRTRFTRIMDDYMREVESAVKSPLRGENGSPNPRSGQRPPVTDPGPNPGPNPGPTPNPNPNPKPNLTLTLTLTLTSECARTQRMGQGGECAGSC
eukprot:TRINITY_DN5643_c0_g1_i3.p1 TRINITY_DN5643_c0_g1~~TRINITY_DN5643_c0_g1_i3.p1  ORF type:complete len:241 (+),score=56.51 TRINITY_DN5643_c0_g1_i3:147-869(+)